jgi:hypothetical protein
MKNNRTENRVVNRMITRKYRLDMEKAVRIPEGEDKICKEIKYRSNNI